MAVPTSSRYFMGYRYGAHSEFDDIIAKDSYGAFAIQATIRNMNPGEFLKDYRVWHLYEHGASNILTGLMKMHQTGRKVFPYVDLVRWALEKPKNKVFYTVMETYLSLPINEKAPLWNLIKESNLLKPIDHRYGYYDNSIRPFHGLSAKASIRLLEFLHSVNPEEIKDFRGSWTDERDGQTYRTVTINGKTWLSENFKYRNKNGVYSLDDVLLGDFAPEGWHIPTPEEWYNLKQDVRISYYKDESSGEYVDFDPGKSLHENDFHALFAKEAWEDAALDRTPGNIPLMEDDIGFGIKPTHRNKRCPGFNFALYWTDLGRSTAAAVVHNKFKDKETGSTPRFIFNRFDLAFGRGSADTFVEAHKNGALGLGCVRLVKD